MDTSTTTCIPAVFDLWGLVGFGDVGLLNSCILSDVSVRFLDPGFGEEVGEEGRSLGYSGEGHLR